MKTARFVSYFLAVCLLVSARGFGEEKKEQAEKPEQSKETHRSSHEMGMMRSRNAGMSEEVIRGRIIDNPKFAKELGLSEEQIKALKSSSEELKKQNEDFQKQLKEAGLEQARKMTEQGPVDEEAMMAAVERTGKINTEMAKARVKHMLFLKKTLTPEQTAKMRDMVQRHIKQMRSEAEKKNGEGRDSGDISRERREHIKKRMEESRRGGTNTGVSVKSADVQDAKGAEQEKAQ